MIKNQILQRAYAAVQQSAKDQGAFKRIVDAGAAVVYDKKLFPQLIKGVEDSENPIETVADGMIGILGILFNQSRRTMPVDTMVSAGMALLIDALDFMEQAGIAKIGNAELAQATKFYINSLLPKLGVTPDQLGQALQGLSASKVA